MSDDYKPKHEAPIPDDHGDGEFVSVEDQKARALVFSNKTYDIGKYFTQIVMPALGTLYFALAAIWGLPHANEVVGSIVAFDTFLGALLMLSAKSYDKSDLKYDGIMQVMQKPDNTKTMSLELNAHPDELEQKKDIAFKVVRK